MSELQVEGGALAMHPVTSGRLVLRRTSEGVIVVGVLHLPAPVRPDPTSVREAWTCRIDLSAGAPRLLVGGYPVPAPGSWDPELADTYLTDCLRHPVWRRYERSTGAFDLRMVRAFPESNGWTVAGVMPGDRWPAGDAEHHRWVDVAAGGLMKPIEPPIGFSLAGMAVAQILRDLPVWPDARGALHTLTVDTPEAARAVCLANVLRVLEAQGFLSIEGRKLLDANLPQLGEAMRLSHVGRDEGFTRYMTELARQGLLRPAGVMPAQAAQKNERAVREVVERQVVQDRRDELNALASQLGVPPCRP